MTQEKYDAYIGLLKEELVPALGCTEPVAIAYGAAKARSVLGAFPDEVTVEISGNIMKNAKSVVVPNTNGLKGIAAAAAAGIVAGNADKGLEVISGITDEDRERINKFLEDHLVKVITVQSERVFDMTVTLKHGSECVKLRIADLHTNIVSIEKNGKSVFDTPVYEMTEDENFENAFLSVKDIVEFADTVSIGDIRGIIEKQINYNMAIAEEGLKGDYGANIGKILLSCYGDDIKIRAKAKAAAASDARMNGCGMPVVIVSGSGNQGLTASVPVIEYARELRCSNDRLYRALVVSNLITLHQKKGIGRLSAYCGAVCAGCGSGAGIAYLMGGGYEEIELTLVNALTIVSGVICDGAKSSCAAKIAASVDAGLLGYYMMKHGQRFKAGEGIIAKDVEATITNICKLGKHGMRETDKEIIRIMG
ncbi:MAG: Serine dehydratase alpha chain [Firmicutes bacterium ADurb.Bin182]|nr:MAG: Serine dehydratase alpha chain [Firmicutes bacterium ADurb.Bin182]